MNQLINSGPCGGPAELSLRSRAGCSETVRPRWLLVDAQYSVTSVVDLPLAGCGEEGVGYRCLCRVRGAARDAASQRGYRHGRCGRVEGRQTGFI